MSEETPRQVRDSILNKISTELAKERGSITIPEASTGQPVKMHASTILRNLDQQFIKRYVFKIEEAKRILKAYIEEITMIENRLSKADAEKRKALGAEEFVTKRADLEETLKKNDAHQRATLKRLTNE